MGDARRFRQFAQFIRENFPNAVAVADVAGGRGLLSLELAQMGYKPVVIDPRPSNLPLTLRKRLRREAMRTGKLLRIPRVKLPVGLADLSPFDLIVGLHPDEATEPIIRESVRCGKSFAVVPCCAMPVDGVRRSVNEWINYLVSLAPGCQVAQLPFNGSNTVIYSRCKDVHTTPAASPGTGARAGLLGGTTRCKDRWRTP